MWDFARGCMRTYLILAEKARRFHQDAEIQAALARREGRPRSAERTTPAGGSAEILATDFDEELLGAQGYGHERLDQLVTELLLGSALRCPACSGSTRRRPAARCEVRDARQRRRRRHGPGAAPAHGAAAQRAAPGRLGSGVPRRVRSGRRPDRRRPTALSVAAQQHGMVVLGERGRGRCGRPSCGTTPSRRLTPPRCSSTLPGAPPPGPRRAGVCQSPASPSPSCPGCVAGEPDDPAPDRRRAVPHDWLTYRLTGRLVTDRGRRLGHRVLVPRWAAIATDLLELVDDGVTGRPCCPRC